MKTWVHVCELWGWDQSDLEAFPLWVLVRYLCLNIKKNVCRNIFCVCKRVYWYHIIYVYFQMYLYVFGEEKKRKKNLTNGWSIWIAMMWRQPLHTSSSGMNCKTYTSHLKIINIFKNSQNKLIIGKNGILLYCFLWGRVITYFFGQKRQIYSCSLNKVVIEKCICKCYIVTSV